MLMNLQREEELLKTSKEFSWQSIDLTQLQSNSSNEYSTNQLYPLVLSADRQCSQQGLGFAWECDVWW